MRTMNKFARFLEKSGLSAKGFAVKHKISQPMVCQLRTGNRKPSLAMAVRIQKITGGKVRPQDWGGNEK